MVFYKGFIRRSTVLEPDVVCNQFKVKCSLNTLKKGHMTPMQELLWEKVAAGQDGPCGGVKGGVSTQDRIQTKDPANPLLSFPCARRIILSSPLFSAGCNPLMPEILAWMLSEMLGSVQDSLGISYMVSVNPHWLHGPSSAMECQTTKDTNINSNLQII